MKVKIITPLRSLELSEIISINIKTIGGEITILPNHYPLISSFDATKVVFKKDKDKEIAFASDGLINIKENEIIIICSAFTFKHEIDKIRAQKSLERAEERLALADESIDKERAKFSKKRAMLRLQIVEEND